MKMKKCMLTLIVVLAITLPSAYAGLVTPAVETANTFGLYNMEETVVAGNGTVVVLDHDAAYPRSGTDWNTIDPDAVGGTGITQVSSRSGFGQAWLFDGVNDYAWSSNAPLVPDSINIQAWVWISSYDTTKPKWIIAGGGAYNLYAEASSTTLTWAPRTTNDGTLYAKASIANDTWQFIDAVFDNGVSTLTVYNEDGSIRDNASRTAASDKVLRLAGQHQYRHLGGFGANNYFKGMMDDVQIATSVIPEPATIALLSLGGLLLRRKKCD